MICVGEKTVITRFNVVPVSSIPGPCYPENSGFRPFLRRNRNNNSVWLKPRMSGIDKIVKVKLTVNSNDLLGRNCDVTFFDDVLVVYR